MQDTLQLMDGTSVGPEMSNLRVKTLEEISSEFEYIDKHKDWKTQYTYFVEPMLSYCGQPIPVSQNLYMLMLGLETISQIFPNSRYFFDVSMITNV